jgi:hypothetical protein
MRCALTAIVAEAQNKSAGIVRDAGGLCLESR